MTPTRHTQLKPFDTTIVLFWFQSLCPFSKDAHIEQSPQTAKALVKFILDESRGFTDIGIERINDSLRTCVYAVLGAQAQDRISFTPDTGLDAKREFLYILEASIDSPVDLQDSIQRYQDSLQYARSQLNFVVGEGLYLLPSDMNLRIGTYVGYNNNILIATSDSSLGSNRAINSESQPPSISDYQPPASGDSHTDENISLVIGVAVLGA